VREAHGEKPSDEPERSDHPGNFHFALNDFFIVTHSLPPDSDPARAPVNRLPFLRLFDVLAIHKTSAAGDGKGFPAG
jgi:hypothetical protein